ncbi:MAG: DUF4382 domain-containing protein [Fimbriimonadaceae bacterium]|nr:DUF4382 domain-containing protein [Fimbriimonadaceae bacterium]
MKKTLIWIAFLIGTLLALFGCGGSSDALAGGSGTNSLFLTDSFRDDFDHVWVKVYGINVVMEGGATVSAYANAEGEVVDVRSLRDNSGERFWFLARASLPSGNVTAIQVVMDEKVTITPTGSTNSTEATIATTVPRNANSQAVVSFNLPTPRPTANGQSFVIDFDLANFTLTGSVLTPVITIGGNTGLNSLERHERRPLEGTVSSLQGAIPNQTFTLNIGQGRAIRVSTSSTTNIFREDNQSLRLANGQRVRVTGVFDVSAQTFVAGEIRVRSNGNGNDDIEARGAASNINAGARSFDLRVRLATGFVPSEATIQVVATSTAVFRANSGRVINDTEFFTALATAAEVEVEGRYNAETNVFTASKLKLDDEENGGGNGGNGNEAEVNGTPTAVNATARTLSVFPIIEIFGFSWGEVPLPVVVTANTTYRSDNGETMSEGDFWASVGSSPLVEVEGHFRAGVLTATKMKLDDD